VQAAAGVVAGIALVAGLFAWSLAQWGSCASERPDGSVVEHDCGSPPQRAT
jgi:hypothetical protein